MTTTEQPTQGPLSHAEAKAQAKAAKAYAKATRPIYRKKRVMLPVALIASIGIGVAAQGGEDTATDAQATESTQSGSVEETADKSGSAKAAEKPAEKKAAEKPAEPKVTAGQENALRSAENYLDFAAFSKTGLIEQLEFEDYSAADATYAANHVEVDWNEQAAKAAENYLDVSAFSKQGLIEQLEFEGYTTAQASYGVAQAGL
jgi:hypothetical protein